MRSFADLLREARQRAGLTQEELAKQVGIDPSYISKIERGIYPPPARDKILSILDALGINKKAIRSYFLLEAGYASSDDLGGVDEDEVLEEQKEIKLPFAVGAFHFPQTKRLEQEVLIEKIRQFLRSPDLSPDERQEYTELIRSFVNWLEFRRREKSERETKK